MTSPGKPNTHLDLTRALMRSSSSRLIASTVRGFRRTSSRS